MITRICLEILMQRSFQEVIIFMLNSLHKILMALNFD